MTPARSGTQYKLFDEAVTFPNGLVYRPDFITSEEEEMLISFIEALPLTHPTGGPEDAYEAKRRTKNFGWRYDFKHEKLIPGPQLPRFLQRFAHRIEKWLNLSRGRVIEALINEYTPGTALGWHRDNETFEHVVGISLGGWARMRWRPLSAIGDKDKILALELEPRSAYVMQGDIRWRWQHSVAATKILRYSITFRTLPKEMRLPRR